MSSRRRFMLAVPAAAFAALLLVAPANASTVSIEDEANILNATTVQNEAATLPVPILIWTSTQDATNKSAFDSATLAKGSSAFPIVMGINPQSHHETLQMNHTQLGLSQSATIAAEQSANSAFDNTMKSANNYTTAVTTALTSLNSSLAARSTGQNASGTKKSSPVGAFITLGIIVIVLIIIVTALRRLFRPARRMRNQMMSGMPMGGGFNQGGFNQGYGPPPGYGYNQGGGMGPGAAGAIGAVGGGLVGYELGKMAGENQQFRQDEMMGGGFNNGGFDNNQNYDNQNFGGGDQGGWVGQDSDFSGGDSGGGGDFGGGGDSGGGGGGDW